ncbi:hypothetical protein [Nonomuraea sp. JJY05]|jgi:IS30 family transposase|uniref:hypothetical protein n=1 Tax=Nonomuraea sp. JJY05 TaxID=3350255 RepID=UPI00373F147B
MRDALVEVMVTLPAHLKRSLTWDQGSEMGRTTSAPSTPATSSYAVAAGLNARPRKTLDWETTAERLVTLLTAGT